MNEDSIISRFKFRIRKCKTLFRLGFSLCATAWMWAIYGVKTLFKNDSFLSFLPFLLLILFIIGGCSYCILKSTSKITAETLSAIKSCKLADNEYVPVFLGYFFVALSIEDINTMVFVYVIVLMFVTLSNLYFNPMFILFGYHYYHIVTKNDVQMFLISKSVARDINSLQFNEPRRLNDWTFISHGGQEQ